MSSLPPLTPQQLVALIKEAAAGNRTAQRTICERLVHPVQCGVARALRRWPLPRDCDLREVRKDFMQEAFVALFANGWSDLRRWDPERGSFDSYFILVTECTVFAALRTRKQNPGTYKPTEDDDLARFIEEREPVVANPEEVLMNAARLPAVLDAAREQMAGKGRWLEMFELIIVENRPVAEICANTGLTPDAVYQWRVRLAALLRRIAAKLSSDS
jgi:RNA polymerase sigma-70 factor, ECF subfamily